MDLKTILALDIPIAIVKNYLTLGRCIDMHAVDWFIIAPIKDHLKLKPYGFRAYRNTNNKRGYGISHRCFCERTMTSNDVEIFKSISDQFIQVMNCEYGRVYEIKGRSMYKIAREVKQRKRNRICG